MFFQSSFLHTTLVSIICIILAILSGSGYELKFTSVIFLYLFFVLRLKATYSSLHASWAKSLKSGTSQCKGGVSFLFFLFMFVWYYKVFIDNFNLNGLGACNTLLALTTFLSVKYLIQVDKDKRYFIGYFLFAFGYPLIVSLLLRCTEK